MLTTNYMRLLYICSHYPENIGSTHEARIFGLSSGRTGMKYDLILSIQKQGSEKQYTPLLLYS